MNLATRSLTWPAAVVLAMVVCPGVHGQQNASERAVATPRPIRNSPYRKLAPHVMKSIDSARSYGESFSRHDVVELLAFDPKFDWAKDITFRHEVWALKFSFKPMRMIPVDVPQASGWMRRKLIWYMVYSVTNPGEVLVPVEDADLPYKTFEQKKTYRVKQVDRPIRFIPEFLLEGRESVSEGDGFSKVYRDRVIPVAIGILKAIGPIWRREDPNRRFYTTVEMSDREIQVGETLWGIATWEDLDPKIDRFSVYVQGLTNAYRWRDAPGEYKRGDRLGKGRRRFQKTLKLNFWRPGDEYAEDETEIRYGFPGEVDYEWVYR